MKPIEGFEGIYSVTEDGKVFTHRRNKFLIPRISAKKKEAYHRVTLCYKGYKKDHKVHRLVAEAYIPNPDNKPQVNHIDGNKTNNHVSNLEWMTHQENIAHAIRTGLSNPRFYNKGHNAGVKNPSSKLTEDDVRFIREHYRFRSKEFNSCSLARKFRVSRPAILYVLGKGTKKTYLDVV